MGTFLPSAIPVRGQPFFGTDPRANLQGDGSAIRLSTTAPPTANFQGIAVAQVMVQNTSFSTVGDASSGSNLTVRQLYAQVNRLSVGLMDSALVDQRAMPDSLDLAGPNARITTYDAGVSGGQGRFSYDQLSDSPLGFEIVGSFEQAIPEISPPGDDRAFAHYPDFIGSLQYLDGYETTKGFVETWHMQWSSVVRNLALESPNADDQSVFGWGTVLSGGYGFAPNPNVEPLDRIKFSVAYGKGISHDIVDLNAAPDTGDAVVNSAGELEALPAFATYVSYTHNWTNCLRSTARLSHVNLNSVLPLGATTSPYKSGEFASINLVRRMTLYAPTDDDAHSDERRLYTGVECLFGHKETLDSAEGEAHRLMFVIVLSNWIRMSCPGHMGSTSASIQPNSDGKNFKAMRERDKNHGVEVVGRRLRKLMSWINAKDVD